MRRGVRRSRRLLFKKKRLLHVGDLDDDFIDRVEQTAQLRLPLHDGVLQTGPLSIGGRY